MQRTKPTGRTTDLGACLPGCTCSGCGRRVGWWSEADGGGGKYCDCRSSSEGRIVKAFSPYDTLNFRVAKSTSKAGSVNLIGHHVTISMIISAWSVIRFVYLEGNKFIYLATVLMHVYKTVIASKNFLI